MDNNEQSQHLEYFKVENFKGLESLELKEIQQFNLILGDNNIGKTSVLEALLFNEEPFLHFQAIYLCYMQKVEIRKYLAGKVDYASPFISLKSDTVSYNYKLESDKTPKSINFSLKKSGFLSDNERVDFLNATNLSPNDIPDKVVQFTIENKNSHFPLDFASYRVKKNNDYNPFITAGIKYQSDLVDFFSKYVNINIQLKKEVISNMHFMSDDIEDVIIDTTTIPENPILMVIFRDGQYLPLYMLGDGIIRLFRLILEIVICQNKRLLIDEIDNGLHFSKMKKVWEVVIKVAAKYNTQLFVTTHDAECLRAFKEVLESEELSHLQEKVASYTLFRNKENKVDAVKYDFRGFEHSIDNDLEVRN